MSRSGNYSPVLRAAFLGAAKVRLSNRFHYSAGKTDRMKIFGLTREENDELIKAENGSISIIEERLQPQPRIMPRKHQEIPSNQQTYCGCLGYVTKVILIFMVAMFLLLMLYVPVCMKEYGNGSDTAEYHNYYPKMLQCSLLMKSVHIQEMTNQTTVVYDTSPNYSLY
ncbi:uncharacterized protein isoform X2 [Rhodnius prolixus]|uniref:uncharacterized protein isoform X2 n=1 Tax=Rhodnius prolixus TaxID=13249 RepID=UPI003D18FAFD